MLTYCCGTSGLHVQFYLRKLACAECPYRHQIIVCTFKCPRLRLCQPQIYFQTVTEFARMHTSCNLHKPNFYSNIRILHVHIYIFIYMRESDLYNPVCANKTDRVNPSLDVFYCSADRQYITYYNVIQKMITTYITRCRSIYYL